MSATIHGLLSLLTNRQTGNDQAATREVSTVANLLNQLSPQLFGNDPPSPEQSGGIPVEREPSTRRIAREQPETYEGMRLLENGQVEIRTSNFRGQYDPDDYEITGEMMPVTSSNVHSIGFQFNLQNPLKSTLLVRYLQGGNGGAAKTKGPLYGYANVHPKLFREFVIANSKGKFVWDELRIRGTIAGSQYRYTLLGIVGNNVPRRALVVNGMQILKRRTKVAADGSRTVRSRLQSQVVGPYRPRSNRPNVGNPNRAVPNRGR